MTDYCGTCEWNGSTSSGWIRLYCAIIAQPENLLYSSAEPEAEIKVADFGFAAWTGRDHFLKRICGAQLYCGTHSLTVGSIRPHALQVARAGCARQSLPYAAVHGRALVSQPVRLNLRSRARGSRVYLSVLTVLSMDRQCLLPAVGCARA